MNGAGSLVLLALAAGCTSGSGVPLPDGKDGLEPFTIPSIGGAGLWPGPAVELTASGPHTVSVGLDAWAGIDVTVTCLGGDDIHTRATLAEAGDPVVFRGLLAGQDYRCRSDDGLGHVAYAEVTTPPAEHPLPDLTMEGDPDTIGRGYLLFNVFVNSLEADEQQVVITDAEGRVRWSTWIGDDSTGDLDTSWLADGTVLYGGGYELPPTIVSLAGETLWVAPDAPTGRDYHHHARQGADGSIISMTAIDDVLDGEDYLGHWIGAWTADGELAWEWQTSQAVAQGALEPSMSASDPFHVNAAVEVDWDGCDLLVSARNTDTLTCADRATGDVAWTLSEDFQLVNADGDPVADNWTDGQHDPTPYGDKLLVFDNGRDRTGDVRTRIVEYELDTEARTARLLWTYFEDGWNESVWGGVKRFGEDDEMVLIALPHCMDCSSDSSDVARSALIALDADREPVWRLTFDEETVGLYRATWIDPCDVFENERFCEG